MNIRNETFSDLLNKYVLISIELTRLNALMVYYADLGNTTKSAQTVDAVKRLEMSKAAIALELDRRLPNDYDSYITE